jgi:hypothetical protein
MIFVVLVNERFCKHPRAFVVGRREDKVEEDFSAVNTMFPAVVDGQGVDQMLESMTVVLY